MYILKYSILNTAKYITNFTIYLLYYVKLERVGIVCPIRISLM